MIRIIDSTMAVLDKYEPTKKQLLQFCELMKGVGIVDLEVSHSACQAMGQLPKGFRFYLAPDERCTSKAKYDVHKVIQLHSEEEGILSQFQINDIREIVQLRPYKNCAYMRIIGLDDLLCHNYSYVMKEMKEILCRTKINFCPEDSFHCATALAVEWIMSGQDEVTTSLAGVGNRAATEEVIMALRVNRRYKTTQNIEGFNELKTLLEEITSRLLSPTKPIIGDDIFLVESGIHVDGIIKKATNYSPYLAEEMGRSMRITIGKHSGSMSIMMKLKEYEIFIEDKRLLGEILKEVKKASMRLKRGLEDIEFLTLAKEMIGNEREAMGS